VAAIVTVVLTGAVCGFFIYVLVQFRRDEKHPRRHEDLPTGFPIVASGQIVAPLREPNGHRLGNGVRHKDPCGSSNEENVS
jgi:hypothetical protein